MIEFVALYVFQFCYVPVTTLEQLNIIIILYKKTREKETSFNPFTVIVLVNNRNLDTQVKRRIQFENHRRNVMSSVGRGNSQ